MAFKNYYGKPNWHYWVGGISAIIVFLSNYFTLKNFKQSLINTFLDFDASLTAYIDKLVSKSSIMTNTDMILPIIIIMAHMGIFVFIFMFIYYFTNGNLLQTLVFSFLAIFILHVVNFSIFQNEKMSFESIKNLFPGRGIWHLIKEMPNINVENVISLDSENTTIIQNNTTNVTQNTVNLDLT